MSIASKRNSTFKKLNNVKKNIMLKCMLIGLGNIGMGYDLEFNSNSNILTHAKAINLHSNFELIAGIDNSKSRRMEFKKKYNKPVYNDVEKAISIHSPDIVVIATPTITRFSLINLILNSFNPRVILCEKPIDYNLSQAKKIIKSCRQKNVHFFVNYMRLSDNGVINIKERISKNIINQPIKGIAWYTKGFIHNASHLFNLMEFWLGKYKKSKIINISNYKGYDYKADLEVAFENGSIVFLSLDKRFSPLFTIELICKTGRLFYEQGGNKIIWQSIYKNKNEIINNSMATYQMSVYNEIDAFLNNKSYNLCSGDDALKTLISINKALNLYGNSKKI